MRQSGPTDLVAYCLLAGLCLLAIFVFGHYGISNDEEVQHRYGELIVSYYTSGFSDLSLFGYKNLYLYGGLFDIVAVLLAKALPFDVYSIRHLLSALCGIGGIAAAFATARLVAGARAGLIALVSLAVCGPYFGGMFNHTKDVPFAAAMMAALYFLLRAARDLPRPHWSHLAGFGVSLGAATGLRALGLLLLGYALMLIALSAFAGASRPEGMAARLRFATLGLVYFIPAMLIGYGIMIAAWPWASLAPLNPLWAIFSFAHFHYEIRTIVAGAIYKMADVPWWYVPLYLAVKTPIVVLVGAVIALVATMLTVFRDGFRAPSRRAIETGFLIFVACFPVLCEAISEGPAFTGMRHFLFVVPVLAVLAGIGFDWALEALRGLRLLQLGGAAVLAAALLHNAVVLASLHPYETLFYNQFVGGLEGAQRRFVMDYWVNMMPEAVRALRDYLNLDQDTSQRVYTVGVCGEKFAFDAYAGPHLDASGAWLESDFFIAPSHMNCDKLIAGRTVFTIRRQGVAIGVVEDRRGISQKALAPAFE